MRISIESKHYAVSAIVALALAVVAILTWYRSQSINELHTQREAIYHIDTSLHRLHKVHVDFVTLYEPKYLNAFSVEYENLNAEIKQVGVNLGQLGHGGGLVSQLLGELSNYKLFFDDIATLQQKIGKDQTEGVRKKMRDSLYVIENHLAGIGDENVRNAIHRRMLMTQRPEKDLMLRRQAKYVAKFDRYYDLTVADVETFIDDPALKSQLIIALGAYKGFFEQLSTVALKIGLTYEDGLRYQTAIVVKGAHHTVSELAEYVSAAISQKETEINGLILLACVVFSALIILLTFLLTRSIVRPLKEVTHAMTTLAGGDYKVKISGADRPDEIGAMAQALRVFKLNAIEKDRAKNALQKAHNELEQRVDERTGELKKANHELIESNKKAEAASIAKGHFLANMSHELRTPLNAIIGFSSTLQEEIFGKLNTDKQKEYVGDIHLSGNHLLELINDILDVSAIEAGKLEFHEENVAVDEVLGDAVRLIAPRADLRSVDISVSLPDALPALRADARRLQQILLNLLSNATKFSDEGGTVSLAVRANDDASMSFDISDQGIGMSEQELATAMEPFGQVTEASHTSKYQGTGLGLPLVKALAEMHDATLEISSKKGAGTSVTITFPAERVVWVTPKADEREAVRSTTGIS